MKEDKNKFHLFEHHKREYLFNNAIVNANIYLSYFLLNYRFFNCQNLGEQNTFDHSSSCTHFYHSQYAARQWIIVATI